MQLRHITDGVGLALVVFFLHICYLSRAPSLLLGTDSTGASQKEGMLDGACDTDGVILGVAMRCIGGFYSYIGWGFCGQETVRFFGRGLDDTSGIHNR